MLITYAKSRDLRCCGRTFKVALSGSFVKNIFCLRYENSLFATFGPALESTHRFVHRELRGGQWMCFDVANHH